MIGVTPPVTLGFLPGVTLGVTLVFLPGVTLGVTLGVTPPVTLIRVLEMGLDDRVEALLNF
eukprot:1375425-Amorphochlora_amoeboformis.AAC.1